MVFRQIEMLMRGGVDILCITKQPSSFDELVDLEKGRLRVLFDWGFGNGDMSEIRKEFQRIISENYKLNERSD